ncbi:MAG: hypothetical protein JWR37_2096 [Mycobacterium sp.]|nr:hypothetical protein [Mycobacterium sp.]
MSARVSPTDRIRGEIDAFDGSRDLSEVVEDVARLGARLIIQAAAEGCRPVLHGSHPTAQATALFLSLETPPTSRTSGSLCSPDELTYAEGGRHRPCQWKPRLSYALSRHRASRGSFTVPFTTVSSSRCLARLADTDLAQNLAPRTPHYRCSLAAARKTAIVGSPTGRHPRQPARGKIRGLGVIPASAGPACSSRAFVPCVSVTADRRRSRPACRQWCW